MRLRVTLGLVAAVALAALGFTASTASSAPSARTQHFVGFSNNASTDGLGTIVALGPVSGSGRDVAVDEHHDRFVFAHGSVNVTHRATSHHDTFDPTTCVFDHVENGAYTVTGGRGAYANAHGSGTYKVRVLAQGCDEHKPPTALALTLDASGPLSAG